MKYTVIDPSSEKKLFILDTDSKENKEKKFEKTGTFIRVTGNDSQVSIIAVSAASKVRQYNISSSLGNISVQLERGEMAHDSNTSASTKKILKSQMPGKLLRILCKEGDVVKTGDPLLVVEAMKMENEIKSPKDGVIEKLMVTLGKAIESGESLLVIG